MGQFRSLERLVLERNELRSSPTYDDPADVEQYGGWTLFAALSSPHKLLAFRVSVYTSKRARPGSGSSRARAGFESRSLF